MSIGVILAFFGVIILVVFLTRNMIGSTSGTARPDMLDRDAQSFANSNQDNSSAAHCSDHPSDCSGGSQ